MKYSVIIPVYNRPQELAELLESLARQTLKDPSVLIEVIVVDDGSRQRAEPVAAQYAERLDIHYFYKTNSGPGSARNYGFERASGDFFLMFDSDCLIPPDYFNIVHKHVKYNEVQSFGGPDASLPSFTLTQKAINYAMTSYFTTGGIRGKKKRIGPYQARSFNMGFSRKVYEATGGFRNLRVSEDIDLSIRIRKAGFETVLIPEAFVYHKRRTSLRQFFFQTYAFGKGRVNIAKIYPSEARLVHTFPTLFVIFCLSMIFTPLLSFSFFQIQLSAVLFYLTLVLSDAITSNQSLSVGLMAVPTVLVQMTGYGLGFLDGLISPKNLGTARAKPVKE
ncbi:glycosyltransferase [Eisenibacter elegans]|uniref:glycosyltransferase n=1 Tax=Eisenibacter elegans TaxID=997 RepID=UPI0003FEA6B8|nr:glycosyltransferase [Eisenibacter elegans]